MQTNQPDAQLLASLRSYRAMPGCRNRCTRSQQLAADAAFSALRDRAEAAGFTVSRLAMILDGIE